MSYFVPMIYFWSFCCPISFDLFDIFENHELENWIPLVKQPRSGGTICKYMEACILCLTLGTVRVFWLVQACTKSIHTGAVYWHEMGHFMWQELRSYNCYSLVNLPQLPLQERKEPLKAERVAINSLYFTLYTLMSGPGYFWCWVGRQQSALKNNPLTQWFLKFSWFQASRALQTLRMLIKEFA